MKKFAFYIFLIVLLFSFSLFSYKSSQNEINILSYTIDSEKQELNFYWKDDNGNNYLNFQNLKAKLENNKKKLVFATNGGMYNKALLPQGLYIENGKLLKDLDTIFNLMVFFIYQTKEFQIFVLPKVSCIVNLLNMLLNQGQCY